MPAGENREGEQGSLDLDHLADLANLPLEEGERSELADACREVLEAFELEELAEAGDEQGAMGTFADEAEPWPEGGIDAILEQFPDRDGRSLRP